MMMVVITVANGAVTITEALLEVVAMAKKVVGMKGKAIMEL